MTGLAFIAANLGAIEIIGMSANGAQYGMPTMHYFWIGAVPAMLFLGVVMMPFYYGSKVRSVPEFMLRRFGKAAHLVNGISFALAQILIAGANLYLLALVINLLLGWPIWVSVILAAVITELEGVEVVVPSTVERFFTADLAFLQDMYQRINNVEPPMMKVVCPDCGKIHEVPINFTREG